MDSTDSAAPNRSLGVRIDTFKPMVGNIFAGFTISVLICSIATILLRYACVRVIRADYDMPLIGDGMCWGVVALMLLAVAAILFVGIAFFLHAKLLIGLRVDVHENGFRHRARRRTEEILWSEVHHIRETITYERPPVLNWPASLLLPQLASVSYIVCTARDKNYSFDGNDVSAIKRFGRVLRARADLFSIHWEIVEEHL